jgi:23S rRNA (cytidine2498-2'-O)-methyltransferase
MRELRFDQLIFPRQWARGGFIELPETDRISVLLEHLAELPVFGSLWLEVLDTTARNCPPSAASSKCRCARPGEGRAAGRRRQSAALLLTFMAGGCLSAPKRATGAVAHGHPAPEVPREAPSRSTLKLEEAWHQFIPREQWDQRLDDMTGVDLGPAPGLDLPAGAPWHAGDRHRQRPMAESLMDTGLVST